MGISPPDPDDSLSLRGYMACIRNAWLCKCVCMSSMLWNNTVLRLMFNIAIRRYHPHTGEYNFNNTITYRPDQLNIIYINASEVQQHKLLSTPTVQEDRPFETIEKEQGVIWEIGKVLSVSLFLCVSSVRDHTHTQTHVHTHVHKRAHTRVRMETSTWARRDQPFAHTCTKAKYTHKQMHILSIN